MGGRRPGQAPQRAAASPRGGGGRRPDSALWGELSPAPPGPARAPGLRSCSEACGEGVFPPHLPAYGTRPRPPQARASPPLLAASHRPRPQCFPTRVTVLPPTSPSGGSPTPGHIFPTVQKAALRHRALAPVSLSQPLCSRG